MVEKPCPSFIVVEGKRLYCEQGPKGHKGTCYGEKPEWQYRLDCEKASLA